MCHRALAAITAGELDEDCYAIAKYIFRLIRDGEMYECGDFMVKRYVEEIISKSLDGEDWHRYAESRARKCMANTHSHAHGHSSSFRCRSPC